MAKTNPNYSETNEGNPIIEVEAITTAIVKIKPEADLTVLSLKLEVDKLLVWAESRVVADNNDVVCATDDLSGLSNLRKAIESRRKEYTVPLDDYKKTIMDFFKRLTDPLEEADKITRGKILAYRREIDRKRVESEAIERERLDLARREEALTGEHTVDLVTPIERPEAVPNHIYTETGALGTVITWKFEVLDFSILPEEYKMVDAAKIGRVVRAGLRSLPGVRIYADESLRITPQR